MIHNAIKRSDTLLFIYKNTSTLTGMPCVHMVQSVVCRGSTDGHHGQSARMARVRIFMETSRQEKYSV